MRINNGMTNTEVVAFINDYVEEYTQMSAHSRSTLKQLLEEMAVDADAKKDAEKEIQDLKNEIEDLGYEIINQANLNDL